MRSLRLIFRLFGIARILARHDALAPFAGMGIAPQIVWLARLWPGRFQSEQTAGARAGQKLALALTDLGPSFIKLGQTLSTRADLLGDEVAADLSQLQDNIPPFDAATARTSIEAELGRPLAELFAGFDDKPVSAASIAQVHFAVTTEGEEVAVKILRPEIEAAFERDLELFYWLADLAEAHQPKLRRLRPRDVVRLFEQTVRIEMDLRMEAAAASELRQNFEGDDSYAVPAVDWTRTARRVLTQERVAGIPMDDREALLAAGHDLDAVMEKAATVFFKQVFRDGFFHGDQHPGNMFIGEAGDIRVVDFGIMGRLDHKTRCFLADMLVATLERDYQRLAEVHVEAGFLPAGLPTATFAQALRSVCEPIFGKSLEQISFARLLGQLLRLTESFEMPVQPQLLLLQKNMLIAEGISRQLVPDLNIWSLAAPLIREWIEANRGPEMRIKESAGAMLDRLESLPQTLANIELAAAALAKGGLRLDPETIRGFQGGKAVRQWSHAALWFAVGLLLLLYLLD